ncbi:hypothetical protein [Roseibium sp. Sym1]|uniref:hypothetical protein n=1 Tax=Roseibium sp. Sym1 TaxID=3016006 RepID=UPI0022B51256|nr:hypothetical protein [Roseibium sp. Sym1]
MTRRQAKKSIRDIVRETITPSRVGLLSWASAAVFMGTVGLASYQFSYDHSGFGPVDRVPAGLALPPAGDVDSTASISRTPTPGAALEVMQLPAETPTARSVPLDSGQLEVLQLEIVGLRRRLSALSEQNAAYSRRIAALEKQSALEKLAGAGRSGNNAAEPGPGVVITKAVPAPPPSPQPVPSPAKNADRSSASTSAGETHQAADSPVPQPSPGQPSPEQPAKTAPRLINLYRNTPGTEAQDAAENNPNAPVRIVRKQDSIQPPKVRLPDSTDAPVSTGSIPTGAETAPPEAFDPTPTQTTLRPKVITPSTPSGRLRGGGDRQLKRSDFGAIIGHYRTSAAAAKAWADFKTQNEERMRDLRPLLMNRKTADGGVALMVGPFANAADAALACFQLLDVAELCHPALYAGDPLVTAAEFRDSAF